MIRRLIATTLLMLSTLAWSDSFLDISLTESTPGQYVYYLDTRSEKPRYLGFLLIDEGHYLVRMYRPDSGEEARVNIKTTFGPDGAPSIDGMGIQMGAEKYAGDLSVDILNIISQRTRVDEDLFPDIVTIDDPWPELGYEFQHSYEYWIPLFQLRSTVDKKDPAKKLLLMHYGKVGDNNSVFLSFTGVPTAMPGPSFFLSPKSPTPVEIDGLRAPLDSHWISDDGRLYRIVNVTSQDALFIVESINLDYQQIDDIMILVKYLILGNPDKYLIPDSVVIREHNEMPVVEFSILDPISKKITKQVSLFIPRGGPVWSIATISAFESLYNQNKDYFEHILF